MHQKPTRGKRHRLAFGGDNGNPNRGAESVRMCRAAQYERTKTMWAMEGLLFLLLLVGLVRLIQAELSHRATMDKLDAILDALADQLGHASTNTTHIYARIADKITENPARYLEAMLAD